MTGDRRRVQARDHSEPEIQNMKDQKEEKKYAGDPLKQIKPVSCKAILESIRSRLAGDDDAVDRVKRERYEDTQYLDEQEIWNIVDVLHMVVENFRSAHRGRIRIHVHEKKHTERDNARQLVQLSQKKSIAK